MPINRAEKYLGEKRAEERKDLSEEECRQRDAADALTKDVHFEMFSEEYDFMMDSISDANDRKKGENPMNSEYTAKANARRKALGVPPLGPNGMRTNRQFKLGHGPERGASPARVNRTLVQAPSPCAVSLLAYDQSNGKTRYCGSWLTPPILIIQASSPMPYPIEDYECPAGIVLPSQVVDDDDDWELRIAFDFDRVIADDASERVFKGVELGAFHQHETSKVEVPHSPGPLADLFRKLSLLQKLEDGTKETDASYQRILRTTIVTARSAPAHERVITTLESAVSLGQIRIVSGFSYLIRTSCIRSNIADTMTRNHAPQ